MVNYTHKNSKETTNTNTIISLMEYLVNLIGIAIIILIPLYMKDGYYDISLYKFNIYLYITALGFTTLTILAILSLMMQRKNLSLQKLKNSLSITDISFSLYAICAIISFCLSDYKESAWMGDIDWNMGLYAQITFVFLYFSLSRFGKNYKTIFHILLGVNGIVLLLGILNRFLIDPLGVYIGLTEVDQLQYLSTLGQSSWYSSFISIVLPISIFYFWQSNDKLKHILSGAYILLGFMSLITQNSDSAYFAFAGTMLVFLWVSFEHCSKLKRFVEIILLFAIAAKIVWLLSFVGDATIIEQLDTLSTFLISSSFAWFIIAVCIVMLTLFYLLQKKQISYPAHIMKQVRNLILCFICLSIIGAVCCIVYSAITGKEHILSSIPYLSWNDQWGNGRGFTWKATWKMFSEMNLTNKLFGVGPDCYSCYGYDYYNSLLESKWGGCVLANAHNEWFNALINYGIIGAVSYLGIFITTMMKCARQTAKSPQMIMILACITAYFCHNFFCYQQIICTPIIMIIMGLGSYILRNTE